MSEYTDVGRGLAWTELHDRFGDLPVPSAEVWKVEADRRIAEERAIAAETELEELCRYRDETQLRLRSDLDFAVSVLNEMARFYGAAHGDECPEDDTCDCEMKLFNERVNAACRLGYASRQLSVLVGGEVDEGAAHKEPKEEHDGTATEV